jgi:hypothetical protein
MYKNTGANKGPEGPGAGHDGHGGHNGHAAGGEKKKDGDDVIDADFKEV